MGTGKHGGVVSCRRNTTLNGCIASIFILLLVRIAMISVRAHVVLAEQGHSTVQQLQRAVQRWRPGCQAPPGTTPTQQAACFLSACNAVSERVLQKPRIAQKVSAVSVAKAVNSIFHGLRASLGSSAAQVPVVDVRQMTGAQLRDALLHRFQPVVIRGLVPLGTRAKWTQEYLLSAVGDQRAEFQDVRQRDNEHVTGTIKEWMEHRAGAWKLDQLPVYLDGAGDAGAGAVGGAAALGKDLRAFRRTAQRYLRVKVQRMDVHAGTEAQRHLPLHTDGASSNIACQVSGDKTWTIFPPQATALLLQEAGMQLGSDAYMGCSQCRSGACQGHVHRKAAAARAGRLRIRVAQDDCIALPPYWWHTTEYHAPRASQRAPTGFSIGFSSNFEFGDGGADTVAEEMEQSASAILRLLRGSDNKLLLLTAEDD